MNERISSAALRIGKMIVSAPPPARHHTLLHAFYNYNRKTQIKPSDQGFLTSDGRYVERDEAWTIADAAGQIKRVTCTAGPGKLFSEDMW